MVSRRTAFVHLPDRATSAITPTRPLLGQARAPLPEAALTACYVRLAARRSPRGDRLWGQLSGPGPHDRHGGRHSAADTPAGGPAADPAEVAWMLARAAATPGKPRAASSPCCGRLPLEKRLHRAVTRGPTRRHKQPMTALRKPPIGTIRPPNKPGAQSESIQHQ